MTSEAFIEQAKLYSSIGEFTLKQDLNNHLIRIELRAHINGYLSGTSANIDEKSLEHMSPREANTLLGEIYAVQLKYCTEQIYKPHGWLNEIEVQTSIAEETNE